MRQATAFAVAAVLLAELLTAQEPATRPAGSDESTQVPSHFVRFVRVGDGGHLDTAITTYRNALGVEVTLLAAVHIADASHYETLQQRFATFDALLYELVGPDTYRPKPGERRSQSLISMLQTMLKSMLELRFQLDSIDYTPANFVHADLTPQAFQEQMAQRGESLFGLLLKSMLDNMQRLQKDGAAPAGFDLVAATRNGESRHRLRMLFASVLENVEKLAFGGPEGSTLVEGRNEKCLAVLKKQLEDGKKKLGIYYGAAHFPHIEKRLVNDLGFHKVKQEWLVAWDCTKRPDPKFDRQEFGRIQLARNELGEIAAAVKQWRRTHGAQVPALADLSAKGADGTAAYAGSSADPWGHDYVIRQRGASYEVACAGRDGRLGSRDDLVVAEPDPDGR